MKDSIEKPKVEIEDLFKIKLNKKNPREITNENFQILINSILAFPEMLYQVKQIAYDVKEGVLCGNQRVKALTSISQLSYDEIEERLNNIDDFRLKDLEDKAKLLNFWKKWKEKPNAPIIRVDNFTDAQKQELVAKDNINLGKWNYDELANEWDQCLLEGWGLHIPNLEPYMQEKEDEFEKEINEITNNDCEMPIVPQFFEHHECFVIPVHNTIDEQFVRDLFDLNKNYISESGDGKVRKTNVISIDKLRGLAL